MSTTTTSRRSTEPTQGRSPDIARPLARKAKWTDLDVRAVDTVRLLAADAVQKAGNGHPGTAMSLAPVAYLLYQNVMTHDPSDPAWLGRDRFVLSCGHSSLTQYIQLFLSGYGLELKDLKALRTWGSLTPGHPEVHHTKGVEITTGPLGSGLASAVGMAMAQRRQRGLLDPDAAPGESVFDHHVWVLASDGDLMEGVASEASSLAGHQELGNLTVVYDANQISIEDDTDISFSEDVAKRYEAYGWDVVDVDWRRSSNPAGTADYTEDVDTLLRGTPEEQEVAQPAHPRAPAHRHRLAGPDRPRHRQVARLGAGRRRDRRDQGAARLRPEEDLRGRPRRARPRPRRQEARQGRPPGLEQAVCRVAQGERRPRRAARPPRRRPPPRRVREGPAGLPRRRQGPGDARGIRQGARRPGRRAARAVGRLGRPRRVEQHHDGGRSTRSSPRASRPASGRAAPTGAPCTSASARTPWA